MRKIRLTAEPSQASVVVEEVGTETPSAMAFQRAPAHPDPSHMSLESVSRILYAMYKTPPATGMFALDRRA